ncbi:hypothetical protein PV08_02146 [Exophiala spinifera]|uniref:YMC020W-like alpha/beta hydrolase domain-containing protein n=1 Tax=Exophiala spinifera TaxID=91928 RepID=A0A0D1Z1P7_9EURO|nr:uncharacterized protein PV08_02146 [Exophiala spinifera]KIW21566.1 hypothetical protein PV08_02146 [Exophiala spinifera]
MAPSRPLKRQKTNPSKPPASLSDQKEPANIPLPPETSPSPTTTVPAAYPEEGKTSSWISRTWPRKARPVAQVARESVPSTSNTAQEVVSIVKDKARSLRSPSLAMTLGKTSSNRSLPVDATTTAVNATAEATTNPIAEATVKNDKRNASLEPSDKTVPNSRIDKITQEDDGKPEKAASNNVPVQQNIPGQQQNSQGTWLSWLARRDDSTMRSTDVQQPPTSDMESGNTQIPPTEADTTTTSPTTTTEPQELPENSRNKRSWYQMWGGDASARPQKAASSSVETNTAGADTPLQTNNLDIPAPQTPKTTSASQTSSLETSPPPQLSGDGSKSAGWVFWSRDRKLQPSATLENDPHVGEIAISGTPSQARPKRASISLQEDASRPVVKPPQPQDISKQVEAEKNATGKSSTAEQVSAPKSEKKTSTKKEGKSTKAESSNATAIAREPVEAGTPRQQSPAPSKKEAPNLLLPAISDTLSSEEHPSILQQLARLLYYTKGPDMKHLSLIKDPPKIKNALAIGVHGYFPAPLIRTVLGQPTGTSIKFADMAAKCIRKWTRSHGYECEVKSAALEGEGRITERVELLWKLLLNWIDEIRKSDFVMIACHSQGVPVAIMLVAKLIQFGCISGARVGICAMAGVNMGPFQEYKSRWISGSAGELFEFSDPNSSVSRSYLEAMEVILRFGVRLTFIGSIDDQLVSMESSIFAPLTHPHIYRAVFIDSRVHAPNFLSHLVGFALKLRNVGVPDHGLIRELSSPLAGSLYGGEGHSRIYEDDAVYDIAISFALETNALKDVPISKRQTSATGANPYILPFAMRGILEEDYVKTELQNEARELLAQFDDWKPTTKALKDVKFRLEGIRSRL